MENGVNVSIAIPLRVDSAERERNLKFVLSLLLQETFVSVDILEADAEPHFCLIDDDNRIRYRFVKDCDPIFHRTRYLNDLILAARNPIVGVWDTDVIISSAQLIAAVESIQLGSVMCFPYDGRFVFLNKEVSCLVRNEPAILDELDASSSLGRPSVGGAFLVNRAEYLKAGGENEYFYGWGAEDAERVKRMEILELPITRIDGSLFHLHHPRGINSDLDNGCRDIQNLKAFLDTCRKSKAMTHTQKLNGLLMSEFQMTKKLLTQKEQELSEAIEQNRILEKKLNQFQAILAIKTEGPEFDELQIKALMFYQLLRDKPQKQSFHSVEEWSLLFLWTDIAQLKFYTRLKMQYPQLKKRDLQICCLIRLGFNSDEIRTIFDVQQTTSYTDRSHLKKKLSVKEGLESFIRAF